MAAAVRKSKKGKKAQKIKDYTAAYSMMDPESLVKAQVAKYAPKRKETVRKSDVVYRKHPGVYAPTLSPPAFPTVPVRIQKPESKEKPSIGTRILKALRLKEENTPSDREWGKSSLTKIYADDTPGQMFPFQPLFEKKKFVRKKKLEEDGLLGSTLDIYNTPYTLPSSDTIGPEFGNRYSGISGFGTGVQSSIGTGYSYPFGTLAEEAPKSIKKIQEAWEAIGGRDMGTVEKGTDEKKFVDEDWQKVNRQDKTDGLSQAAVNAYRRENPGSKLQTAVTEKNPKGKRAKRRLSFCRRMSGMKKRLTSAKTARDPDSRINKALRRWNCEE